MLLTLTHYSFIVIVAGQCGIYILSELQICIKWNTEGGIFSGSRNSRYNDNIMI